jgi:hypothetical protein
MPLVATRGAASAQGFGEFAQQTAANYIEDVFQTWLYTGNDSTNTITNGIDLSTKGGLVWIKSRSAGYGHYIFDTNRGALNRLASNGTGAQSSISNSLTSFLSNGFSLGSEVGVNESPGNYVSWTFRKQPKFFDVVTYTGTGSARTIAHSLGSVPGCIIVKRLDFDGLWRVYHRSLGATKNLKLNLTDAEATDSAIWNDTAPTSTEFTVGTNGNVNASGSTYVAYLFAHDAGGFGLTGTDNVISCGSYTSATAINLGYEPQWLMVKRADSTGGSWYIINNMTGFTSDVFGPRLIPNSSSAEGNDSVASVTSTGFNSQLVDGAGTYIYVAIRRGPMKTPTTGTSVFSPNLSATTTGTTVTTNFPLDLQVAGYRPGLTPNFGFSDRLRGVSSTSTEVANYLTSTNTAAESTALNFRTLAWSNTGYNQDGYLSGSGSGIYWNFRRAPGFFDEVCYTGTGANRTVSHNLGVVPELMIVKYRDNTSNWTVYSATLANTEYILLNSNGTKLTGTTRWNSTTPTSSVFTVGTDTGVNDSGGTYVAYLFASAAGVSKTGSYTGNGTSQTINCGFTGGARFVLIKKTSGNGNWWVWDSARGIVAGNDPYLALNTTSAEVTTRDSVDTDSSGFIVNDDAGTGINVNGDTYLFLAIA